MSEIIKPLPTLKAKHRAMVRGVIGKPPSQDTLKDFQEVIEKPPADFTPLPPDIIKTIHPKINPT